jgi:predicted  nucleic acid-binding Zn-ribbon protein
MIKLDKGDLQIKH